MLLQKAMEKFVLVYEPSMISDVLQVLREVLSEHEWNFENAFGSLLIFSSESGEGQIFVDYGSKFHPMQYCF